jgi:hypothetical protein
MRARREWNNAIATYDQRSWFSRPDPNFQLGGGAITTRTVGSPGHNQKSYGDGLYEHAPAHPLDPDPIEVGHLRPLLWRELRNLVPNAKVAGANAEGE